VNGGELEGRKEGDGGCVEVEAKGRRAQEMSFVCHLLLDLGPECTLWMKR